MQNLGEILHDTLQELGIEKSIKKYQALFVWPLVVGEKIASVTEPKYISKDKIFIKVKNAAWRNELVFHKAAILSSLNRKLGSGIINEIIFL